MSFTLEVRPQAEAELSEAYGWYERQHAGLGVEFLAEVERAFDRVRSRPMEPPVIHRVVRKALVQRFPYAVFYSVASDKIHVLSVLHSARKRPGWKR